MSVKAKSASVHYPVSDVWLNASGSDVPDYCDIMEIRNEQTGNQALPSNALHGAPTYQQSAYLTWVLANNPNVFRRLDGSTPTRQDHVNAARFIDNGIRVGNDDDGNNLRGVMLESNILDTGEYVGGVNHPERYRRIYRSGTEIRGFRFVGYNEA
jgi:hypothetical protein